MTETVIRVENVGKWYALGAQGGAGGYRTLRESLMTSMQASFRRLRDSFGSSDAARKSSEGFWALQDVSFDVHRGEVVGIIGRNGAGKSTLLKILSRITEPTRGSVAIHGRIASLLEVGTGFHPELTGRENVFLNGAILGMRRAEIKAKFDEIVAFAEVEKFLDTPVKRYSSGMYVRLAFAVAAHLEPEILIVDEVLAVGDMAFQKKCLDKMQDVGAHGRTVIFVSHNMAAVNRLCSRAVLLDQGRVVAEGDTTSVVHRYLQSGLHTTAERRWPDAERGPGDAIARLHAVRVRTQDGETAETVDIRRCVGIEIAYEVLRDGWTVYPGVVCHNEEGVCLFNARDLDPAWKGRRKSAGNYRSTVWIPGNYLAEGLIVVSVALTTYVPLTQHCFERDIVAFQVVDTLEGDSARGDFAGTMGGVIRPMLEWITELDSMSARP
jgi:lipopolysaccharide transport system ATP-binding protein